MLQIAEARRKEELKEAEQRKEKERAEAQSQALIKELEKEIQRQKDRAREKAKDKGKSIKESTPKKKKEFDPARMPRTGGPVIRTPPLSKKESSDSSSSTSTSSMPGKFKFPEQFEKYPAGPSECWEERAIQFEHPKLEASLKKRKEGSKKYTSGYSLDIKTLERLGVREEFVENMELAGLGWLIHLEPRTVPLCLCDEFFTSFNFAQTSDMGKISIRFRLFNAYYEMSLHEWSVRLGLYSVKDIQDGLVEELQSGIPVEEFRLEEDLAWGFLSNSNQGYHYSRVFAYQIVDPVLRLCHVFLVTNLLGTSTAYSKIPTAALFFLWYIVKKRKIHLGFWLAHSIHTISHSPARHLTLCHILAQFLYRNFAFIEPESLASSPQTPPPHKFDLEFLRSAGIIRMVREKPSFYQPGEDPNSILSRSDPEIDRAKGEADKKVKKLEKAVAKLAERQDQQAKEYTQAIKEQTEGLKHMQKSLANLISQMTELAKVQLQQTTSKAADLDAKFDDDKDDTPTPPHDAPPSPPEKKKKRAPRNTRGR